MARPTKYRTEFCDRALGLMRNGASLHEVAADLGIAFETLNTWRKDGKHGPLARALDEGLSLAEAWWRQLGRDGAAGRVPIQPAVWIFQMKNCYGWRDRTETELSGKNGGAIQITWPLPKTALDQ